MIRQRSIDNCHRLLAACLALAATVSPAHAAEYRVTTEGPTVQAVIAKASDGDTIIIGSGVHRANLMVDKPLVLQGEPGAVLDGSGQDDVIRVRVPNVTIRGLTIRSSGRDLTQMNAGIFVERKAAHVLIENNDLDLNTFGVWLDGCKAPRVIGNRIHGDPTVRSQDRGNGVHLYNVEHGVVADNTIWETRDGIYIDTSQDNTLQGNYFRDLRYGLHYMYSHRNRILGNRSRNTRSGFALMQSRELEVIGNRSENDLNYGILMNYVLHSVVKDNVITGVRAWAGPDDSDMGPGGGEGKAIFIYNSLYNEIHGNVFAASEIGIHLTAGAEDNNIHGNAFLANQVQVKYVATRQQEWSRDGRGNYWSDYLGWDLNDDKLGDRPYEPNDSVDKLLWKYPLAKTLMNSPAIEILRWVQTQFPVLRSPGVRDSFPLMVPPEFAAGSM